MEVKLARENQRLKLQNAELRSMNSRIMRRGDTGDLFLEEFRDVIEKGCDFTYKPRQRYTSRSPIDKDHKEVVCLCLSDWHAAEVVRLQETLSCNVFDSNILANRLYDLVERFKRIVKIHQSLYSIEKIVVFALGDFLNGNIHEGYLTNDLSDAAAVLLTTQLMVAVINEIKVLGLPIEIHTAHGNHTRLTVKMPTKRQAHTNLDWLLYESVASHYKNDDQVTVNVSMAQMGMCQVYDWRYVFEHGFDVKHGQEEQYEARIRGLFDDTIFRKATGLTGSSFDAIVIGNMHRSKFLERTVINGCMTGQNELGVSWRLQPIRATQLCWGVSEKLPRTFGYMIDVTDIRTGEPSNDMSEFSNWFMAKHGR